MDSSSPPATEPPLQQQPRAARFLIFLTATTTTMARIWLAFVVAFLIFMAIHPEPGILPKKPDSVAISSDDEAVNIHILSAGDRGAVMGIPALFGAPIQKPAKVRILILENETGCRPFKRQLLAHQETDDAYILIPRGHCPFDVKILNAQRAGFKGGIIYNIATSPYYDHPVRMSAVDATDDEVQIAALFVTDFDGQILRKSAQWGAGVGVVRALIKSAKEKPDSDQLPSGHRKYPHAIDPDQAWDGVFTGIWGDALVSALCFFLGALGAMAVGAALVLLHNRIFGPIPLQSHRPGASAMTKIVVGEDGEMQVERVRLRLRIVTQEDLDGLELKFGKSEEKDGKGFSTDCCAICIDEFKIGCKVRELPCRHAFHQSCIDPWLLNHALLCPTCKRDIIPQLTIASPSAVSINVNDHSPLLDTHSGSSLPAAAVRTVIAYFGSFFAVRESSEPVEEVLGMDGLF
ncbi:hypothetical protein SpCBS45565_g05693 [Spizellomyces sp. 'palustris']|nr:hypothetical protein SpCBS45565_g05693 [Spizellomyces sp. 'palustris']